MAVESGGSEVSTMRFSMARGWLMVLIVVVLLRRAL